MSQFVLFCIAVATLGFRAFDLASLAPPEPASHESNSTDFVLKTVESAPIAFVPHSGVAWRVGVLLGQVAEYMDRHLLSGPAFVRYSADPHARPSAVMDYQVGCVVPAGHEPNEPFQLGEQPSDTVVAMNLAGVERVPSSRRAELRAWIAAQGLIPLGPVTELYRPIPSGRGLLPTLELFELQIVVGKAPMAPAEELPSDANPTKVVTLTLPEFLKDSTTATPLTPIAEGAGESDGDYGAGKVEPSGPPRQVVVVSSLLAEGHYDAVADLLFPERQYRNNASAGSNLRQIASRVCAAARGLERLYPGQNTELLELSKAIDRRRGKGDLGFAVIGLQRRCVYSATSNEFTACMHDYELLAEFDLLLANIAVKRLDAEQAKSRITSLIQRAVEAWTDGGKQ